MVLLRVYFSLGFGPPARPPPLPFGPDVGLRGRNAHPPLCRTRPSAWPALCSPASPLTRRRSSQSLLALPGKGASGGARRGGPRGAPRSAGRVGTATGRRSRGRFVTASTTPAARGGAPTTMAAAPATVQLTAAATTLAEHQTCAARLSSPPLRPPSRRGRGTATTPLRAAAAAARRAARRAWSGMGRGLWAQGRGPRRVRALSLRRTGGCGGPHPSPPCLPPAEVGRGEAGREGGEGKAGEGLAEHKTR